MRDAKTDSDSLKKYSSDGGKEPEGWRLAATRATNLEDGASPMSSVTSPVHLVVKRPWLTRFWEQFKSIFWKNVLVQLRNREASIVRILGPLIFMFLLWVVNTSVVGDKANRNAFDDNPYPTIDPVMPIPSCLDDVYTRSPPCWDFWYTPNNSEAVEAIVTNIRAYNPGRPIPVEQVRGFASIDDVNAFGALNPDRTLGALHFQADGPANISFILQVNNTVKFFLNNFQDPTFFALTPLQVAAEREISRFYWKQSGRLDLEWNFSTSQFAHPPTSSINVVGQALGQFVFIANMFTFVLLLASIVIEKERGLRQAMRTAGMLDSAYWMSWVATELIVGLSNTLLLIAFGAAFQFRFFLVNSFWLVFWLFYMFQLSMTSVAFVLSIFLEKGASAVISGFIIFIIGRVMQSVVGFGYPFTPDNIGTLPFVTVLFAMCPWTLLGKGCVDLGEATADQNSNGIQWADRFSYCQDINDQADQEAFLEGLSGTPYVDFNCTMPLPYLYTIMVIEFVAYFVLALWLDNVVPNANGVRRQPWYFFQPSYWKGANHFTKSSGSGARIKQPLELSKEVAADVVDDPDVVAEEDRMRELLLQRTGAAPGTGSTLAVELYGLQRVFLQAKALGISTATWKKWLTCFLHRPKPAADFWAVKGSWLGIEQGQLLCLLGPNGAGKSTTINLLTGVLPTSGGDALVYGEALSAPGGIDRVRPLMGVCTQFDMLWNELTGYEHLMLYGQLKGLPKRDVQAQAFRLLDSVKLGPVAGQRSGSYSGGMKRRLSVAIALLGDPLVVYLDEPTTGMDPISRRHVWDVIESFKAGRAIVLTTHSMEEADVLGDRIAIMARGRLRALGSGLRLKQRFGSGYQLSVSCAPPKAGAISKEELASRIEAVSAFFKERLDLVPAEENLAYTQFLVPKALEGKLPDFLAELEDRGPELGVTDVQIRLATLEEVFLSIARKAELDAAIALGQPPVEVHLADGGKLLVPVGAEFATCEDTGIHYDITWAQDDSGSLQVLRWTPVEKALGALHEI